MTTPKLKKLLRAASEVINTYLENHNCNPTDPSFNVTTFYDSTEKNSEIVHIDFANWDLTYEFLEPVVAYLSNTDIRWSICREEKIFQFSLYF